VRDSVHVVVDRAADFLASVGGEAHAEDAPVAAVAVPGRELELFEGVERAVGEARLPRGRAEWALN